VRGVEYDFNHTFTEADFPDVSYEEAKGDWMKAYTFAKVNAEKKILSHKSKRGIEYKIVVPPTVIGPSIAPWNTGDEVQSNNRFLYQIFKGEKPARTVEWWADVRSIADAAVQAGDKSKTRGVEHNRYVIVDGTENYHEIIPILLKHFKDYNPGNWEELFASIQDDVKDRKIAKRDLHITESEVKHDSITFEQSVIDVVNEFLKIRD
jgi:nucleoside-diphosphate-sugar epimerase